MEPLPIGHVDEQYNAGKIFTILPEHRRKHMAIFGATGAGKSTLLRNMIAWDIESGTGVTLVDPHGDLVQDILENHIPRSRMNDVIVLSPRDPRWTLGLNILQCGDPTQRALTVSNVISVFKMLWADSWGPRLEDTLRNALFALIEQPEPISLLAIPKLLTDAEYRVEILKNVTNPIVVDFFLNTYNTWKDAFREEAISPVLNKTRAFLSDPYMRALIGQSTSSFDFRWMMDKKKILLCDLSKGIIGDDNARLLGSLIVAKEKLAALTRANIEEDERIPHVLYIEESQNFIGDFPSILAEARKYRLALVLVTQGTEQLPAEANNAIFTNCASLMSFRVSNRDAERLKQEFAMVLPASGLQDVPDYTIYVRTLKSEDGVNRPTGPHIVKTFPPLATFSNAAPAAAVLANSAQRFARPRREVDAKINRFLKPKPEETLIGKAPSSTR